ncbi:hypothetical protein BJ508DRAFT_306663 [Ascobolus immersus RN42]|uniref:Uncharacterized protein n=1 Tax=Ascobolus immersus RN42 TaxID=1160509 RepID=A0A3N4I7E9_ASCIM|nr:hypothetical protein BJ508DRAFT_306663 [Ascobolus immersus RN42]
MYGVISIGVLAATEARAESFLAVNNWKWGVFTALSYLERAMYESGFSEGNPMSQLRHCYFCTQGLIVKCIRVQYKLHQQLIGIFDDCESDSDSEWHDEVIRGISPEDIEPKPHSESSDFQQQELDTEIHNSDYSWQPDSTASYSDEDNDIEAAETRVIRSSGKDRQLNLLHRLYNTINGISGLSLHHKPVHQQFHLLAEHFESHMKQSLTRYYHLGALSYTHETLNKRHSAELLRVGQVYLVPAALQSTTDQLGHLVRAGQGEELDINLIVRLLCAKSFQPERLGELLIRKYLREKGVNSGVVQAITGNTKMEVQVSLDRCEELDE